MLYSVYVIKSKRDDSLYIGLSTDIKKRLSNHNQGLSKYTKGHLPYRPVFISFFPDKFTAANFEKYLKTASGKAFINKRLIK